MINALKKLLNPRQVPLEAKAAETKLKAYRKALPGAYSYRLLIYTQMREEDARLKVNAYLLERGLDLPTRIEVVHHDELVMVMVGLDPQARSQNHAV